MSKLRSFAQAAAEKEQREHVQNALLALVKAAGKLPIPSQALQSLRAGDSLKLEVMPDGSMMLEHVFVDPSAPEPEAG